MVGVKVGDKKVGPGQIDVKLSETLAHHRQGFRGVKSSIDNSRSARRR